MPTVVIGQSLHPRAIEWLAEGLGPEFQVIDRGAASLPSLLDALESAEYAVSQLFTLEMGQRARRLKLLHAQGSGTDDINRQGLPAGCWLCNVYEHEVAIAEYVFMVMLGLARDLPALAAGLRAGDMGPAGPYGGPLLQEFLGTTRGIVGYGRSGREVARRARLFGRRVLAVKAHPDPTLAQSDGLDFLGGTEDIPRVMAESDFVL